MLSDCCLQDFFNQIVQHEMVAAGERFDKAGGVLMPLHRNRGQLQAGNPAFGAGFQCGDVFRVKGSSPSSWLRNSAASAGVKRRSAARSSVSWPRARSRAKGSWWILTGGDSQMHLRWQVLEQKGEGFVNRFGIDHVVVVQNEDEMIWNEW